MKKKNTISIGNTSNTRLKFECVLFFFLCLFERKMCITKQKHQRSHEKILLENYEKKNMTSKTMQPNKQTNESRKEEICYHNLVCLNLLCKTLHHTVSFALLSQKTAIIQKLLDFYKTY